MIVDARKDRYRLSTFLLSTLKATVVSIYDRIIIEAWFWRPLTDPEKKKVGS
jgi:hypothetical protein